MLIVVILGLSLGIDVEDDDFVAGGLQGKIGGKCLNRTILIGM